MKQKNDIIRFQKNKVKMLKNLKNLKTFKNIIFI